MLLRPGLQLVQHPSLTAAHQGQLIRVSKRLLSATPGTLDTNSLRPFAFAESMILLGSIERSQIVALLNGQLSYARRLLYVQQQKAQAEHRVAEKSQENEGHQPSDVGVRFQVRRAKAGFLSQLSPGICL